MRTFVAIELDHATHAALAACTEMMRAAHPPLPLKWVPSENRHLTLQFLGEIPMTLAEAVSAALQAAVREIAPFSITLKGTGCFPDCGRPNVLWAGVFEPSGALSRLQQQVAAQLAPLGFPPEEGPFNPHLTLARLPRGVASAQRRAVGTWFARQPAPAAVSMPVGSICFMHSDLQHARYLSLATIALQQQHSTPRG